MSHQQNNNALIQQLKKHFNLENELFSEDSGFFFAGAQRQHNLETLRHMASFADVVLFLTGDKNSGKTHLLKALCNSSFEGLNVIYLDCERLVQEAQGRSDYILASCLSSLGVRDKKETGSIALLNYLLGECHRLVASDGVRTLFAFDNADKLPRKELQEYCNFCKELPSESALVMLFAGPSSLIQTSKLGSNLDKDAWLHQIQLKPLSQVEVLPYLEQALMLAGYSGKLELTELQIQQLVDLGKGLPGRINKLFPSVVLESGLLKLKKPARSQGAPLGIMFGLVGLLVISFLFVSFQHGLFDRLVPVFSLDDDVIAGAPVLIEEINSAKLLDESARQQKNRIAMLDKMMKDHGVQVSELVKNDPINSAVKNTEISGSDKFQQDEVPQVVEVVDVVEGQVGVFGREVESDDGELNDAEIENVEAVSVHQEKMNEVVRVDPANNKTQVLEKSSVQKVVNEQVSRSPFFRSKEWLQKQTEGAYLSQILGSYSEKTALNFIEKIGKQKFEVFYLETEHKGKVWYVVFYGVFPGKSHAQDAVKNSPKIIRDQNPWIRRSAEVLASYSK